MKKDLSTRLTGFNPSVVDMVPSAERILAFGLFDREALAAPGWYSRRVVPCGSAVHPTSPRLRQGVNQAPEDCYQFSNAFPCIISNEIEGVILSGLKENFKRHAEKRQPWTSALIKGTRAEGGKGVVRSRKADCERHDQAVAVEWQDVEAIVLKIDGLCRGPFDATGTIVSV